MPFKDIIFKGSLANLPHSLIQEYIKIAQERYQDTFNLPPPRIEHYQAFLSLPEPESTERITVIAGTTESVIGYVSSFRNTKYDNIDKAEITIFIRKQYQNKGYESLLLSELLPLLSKEVTLLTFPVREGSYLEQFIKSLGCSLAYTGQWSVKVLDPSELDSAKENAKQQLQIAKSRGFSITQVENGEFHDDIYSDVISMYESLWRDMPSEDLEEEPEVLTPERFKERYDVLKKTQQRAIAFLAIHEATGKPAGITEVYISENHPLVVVQDDTGVLKPFRGNGLGFALKTQLLAYLLENTKATYWLTQNAKSNEHMWRINEAIGYKEWVIHYTYKIKREALQNRLQEMES